MIHDGPQLKRFGFSKIFWIQYTAELITFESAEFPPSCNPSNWPVPPARLLPEITLAPAADCLTPKIVPAFWTEGILALDFLALRPFLLSTFFFRSPPRVTSDSLSIRLRRKKRKKTI